MVKYCQNCKAICYAWPFFIIMHERVKFSLIQMCPYSEFFWSVFSYNWTEYGVIRSIAPYSVQVREILEILEKGVKYVQSYQKKHQNNILVLLL